MAMMETTPEVTGPINLGNPTEFTIRQLAELIVDLTGSRSKIVHRRLATRRSTKATSRHQRGGEDAWLASSCPP